jgi:hypothetical protein
MAEPTGDGREELLWVVAVAGVTLVTVVAAFATGAVTGVPTGTVLAGYGGLILVLMPFVLIAMAAVLTLRAAILRVGSPIAASMPFLKARLGTPSLAAGTIAPIMLTPFLLGAFGVLKQVMPLFEPFTWDSTFAKMGRLMFDGVSPWRITHAIFGSPLETMIIDRIYTAWIPLLFVAVLIFAILAPRDVRARFFLSFSAAWVLLGLVGAFFFSSAGPCYAAAIGSSGAGDFRELMSTLRVIDASGYHLGALEWQRRLWEAHQNRHYGFAMGISAMPSMHNAISLLYALAASRAGLLVRAGTWLFALVILVGSVHLGWHYLVDGLFAWAAMGAIWWGAGAYLRKCGYERALAGAPVSSPKQDDGPTCEAGLLAA